jgi:hypothetical protein
VKMVVSNLPELVPENQTLLVQLMLSVMWMNSFNINGVEVKFYEGDTELVRPPF